MNEKMTKLAKLVAMTALAVTMVNVNSICFFILHQPELPESAKKLLKD